MHSKTVRSSFCAAAALLACAGAVSAQLTISQLAAVGGSQKSWAGPSTNFVEIHNAGAAPADLTGYAIQVTGGTSTTWTVEALPAGFTIPAGGYATLRIGSLPAYPYSPDNPSPNAGFTVNADVAFTSPAMSFLGSKVALTNTQTALSGACPLPSADIVDFVGFGNANCFEGSAPAPVMSDQTGLVLSRDCVGGTDTNDNSADFTLTPASPRNLSSPPNTGGLVATGAPALAAATDVMQNTATLITANASSCAGAATGLQFVVDLSSVNGPSDQPMYDDGTHGDATAGDGTFSISYLIPDTVLPAPAPGPVINRPYIVPITATDSLGRTAPAYAAIYVTAAPTGACCLGSRVVVRTEAGCAAAGGTYRGDNTSPFTTPGTLYNGGSAGIIDAIGDGPTAVVTPTTDTLSISDATIIRELVINLYNDPPTGFTYHPYLGDLSCTLTHGGTTVTLFSRVGFRFQNATGKPGDLWSANFYRFFEGGSGFWNEAYNGGKNGNYLLRSGYYAPSGAQNAPSTLAPFVGTSAAGDWTITFRDYAGFGTPGSFAWSLEINPTSGCCRADFNSSGAVSVQDIFDFLAAYFTGSLAADINNSGSVSVQDIFDYLALYFAGCH